MTRMTRQELQLRLIGIKHEALKAGMTQKSSLRLFLNSGARLYVNWGKGYESYSKLTRLGKPREVCVGFPSQHLKLSLAPHKRDSAGVHYPNVPVGFLAELIEAEEGLDLQRTAENLLSGVDLSKRREAQLRLIA